GSAKVVTHGRQRIAVFHLEDGRLYAIDDRCPHEGFPLSKGFVNQSVVTCRWHAFRFDLKSGRCVLGDEHARSFPVRLVDDRIEVGGVEAPRGRERDRLFGSLVSGVARRRIGQVARDLVRLLELGATPRELLRVAIRYDATHAPYGSTHVLALAHDLEPRLPDIALRLGEDGVVCALLQVFDLCADPLSRHPERTRPEPLDVPDVDPDLVLMRAVEGEDADVAEGLVRGFLREGAPLPVLERWFRRLVDAHLLDLGHSHIYHPKVFAWLYNETGPEAEATRDEVLGAYVRHITLATREELLPEWGAYLRAADLEPVVVDVEALVETLLSGTREAVVRQARGVLAAHGREALVDALVIAASHRLLRYDLAIEFDPTIQEGWLEVTHTLTAAAALRNVDFDERIAWLVAALVHSRAGLDGPPDGWPHLSEAQPDASAEALGDVDDRLMEALNRRDAVAVIAPALEVYKRGGADLLVEHLEDWCLTRGAGRAIFAAHHHKVMLAALDEHHQLRERHRSLAHLPLIAAARFVAAPLQERSLMRLSHEANRFVRLSRVPRRLT
ncbi:MAG TPA: Rieske 2Fe-2S domain-containing protein, partial [Myxococcota bacterium]|nr:Rieske 2Fe-2S domain-containing protein [Myxococcota bacterium]